ncbi:hypothetical protein FQR65_LT16919 [Abscondita terminalis]|nr:hypothetical protein FQR65_LT16919 [Abscondita terminalis]
MHYPKVYDVIVIGGGHAGTEAALAAARMGRQTLLLTHNIETLGQMSCNPAIGGIGKSHLVRESIVVEAMAASAAAKGDIFHKSADDLIVEGDTVKGGLVTQMGIRFDAKTVVLTTGTFLGGVIHVGLNNSSGGRAGDPPSISLAARLRELNLPVGRLKTGTPPRIDARSVDFSVMIPQPGDFPSPTMSFMGDVSMHPEQVNCYITHTNERTHEIIRGGLDRSPMYTGVIEGVGPRYCPSIEDKIHKFADKDSHQVFLEPEGLDTHELYPNGISTSLPFDVQFELINGTTGYEEAGAQGLLAGLNAARRAWDQEQWTPKRDEAYMGVLVDDLITLGTKEPYRMFTSRAEYRLMLREDNADQRLTAIGREMGLVDDERWAAYCEKMEAVEKETGRLQHLWAAPNNPMGSEVSAFVGEQIEIAVKYAGYINRQQEDVAQMKRLEDTKIPADFDYDAVSGLSREITMKLKNVLPETLAQASRIPGVTPAGPVQLGV